MSRNKRVLLSAVALLIVVAIGAVVLLIDRGRSRRSDITLPGGSSGSITVGQLTPAHLNDVDSYLSFNITSENIVSLIAGMRRPEEYKASYLSSVVYEGAETASISSVNLLGGLSRIDVSQFKRPAYSYILTPGFIYGWEQGSLKWTQTPRADFSADELARLPGYKDIADLTPGMISGCGFEQLSEEISEQAIWTIYIEFYDAYGFVHRYNFSIDNGLVVYAKTSYEGGTVYKTAMKSISHTAPSSALFTLPDGSPVS